MLHPPPLAPLFNKVLTWGLGKDGRLGHGDEQDQLAPKIVEVSVIVFTVVNNLTAAPDTFTVGILPRCLYILPPLHSLVWAAPR